jgi:tetratricopeptide (TPR) repeat protein
MENSGTGLDSIVTRRKLAKILGVAPIMLGVVSLEDVAKGATHLYSVSILRKTLHYHTEAYFSGASVGGVGEVQEMVQQIHDISRSLNHKNKDLLGVLAQYAELGAAIAQEEQDYRMSEWFAKWAVSLARKLDDNTLLAGGLMNMSSALYRKGDYANAQKHIDEALSLKLPTPILGAVSLDAARIYSKSGAEGAVKLLETSTSIARKVTTWDNHTILADLGFCHIRGARVLLNLGDTNSALEHIEMADSVVSNKFMRRRSIIQALQAEIYIAKRMYHDALIHADNALTLAKDLAANENLVKGHILNLANLLKASPFGTSREVQVFANRVSLFIGNRNVKPAAC